MFRAAHLQNVDEPAGGGMQISLVAVNGAGSVIASRPPKDLPQGLEQNLGTRSPDDQTLDRKMQICRGC